MSASGENKMDTCFAPAERLVGDELEREIEFVAKHPILHEILTCVGGLLAVLNSQRQIIAINDALLEMLKLENAETALGIRVGEALKCVHACEMPGGCGTSEYCSTCGAAISMVTSLAKDNPIEQNCIIQTEEAGIKRDLYFRVRCVPLTYDQKRLLLLFMQDINYQQRLAHLERVFFHDVNGIIQALLGAHELIAMNQDIDINNYQETIFKSLFRLSSEVSIQQCLSKSELRTYYPVYHPVPMKKLLNEIRSLFSNNPVSKGKSLIILEKSDDIVINSDACLLLRILSNMITNAFEASAQGDEVRVWLEPSQAQITFSVWNRKSIPVDVAKRIFQRNFSTKKEMGSGLGTYTMKFCGEDILGGKVDFVSSEEEGTVFRFCLKR